METNNVFKSTGDRERNFRFLFLDAPDVYDAGDHPQTTWIADKFRFFIVTIIGSRNPNWPKL